MADRNNFQYIVDPLQFARVMWPDYKFYNKERDLIYSVVENRDTICVAGNKLGKDFSAGFIAVWFFCTRRPCRVVTTSVDEMQLNGVLWGEIRNLIQTAKYPLDWRQGGPLLINDLEIKRVYTNGPLKGKIDGKSYLRGRVAKKGEGLLGHHLDETDGVPHTLFIADEASGVDDTSWNASESWAHRRLAIGNPYPCQNFFFRAVEGGVTEDGYKEVGGDIERPAEDPRPGKLRKIITITALDSPNVQYAQAQKLAKQPITGETIVPGVLSYFDYLERMATWNEVRKSIGLHAKFWKGADLLMFPPAWLRRAEEWHEWLLEAKILRRAESMGIDTAEGGDKTSWTIIDRYGIMHQRSILTKDTAQIPSTTLALMREFELESEQVCFDRGNGLQHADALRERGYQVNTVGFGDPVSDDPARSTTPLSRKLGLREQRYSYKNRRAQIYGLIRLLIDPSRLEAKAALAAMEKGSQKSPRKFYDVDPDDDPWNVQAQVDEALKAAKSRQVSATTPDLIGFAIPAKYGELHRQMGPIPLKHDAEGRMYLIPKDKPNINYKGVTMKQLLGGSPDELDSLAIACFNMLCKPTTNYVGAID